MASSSSVRVHCAIAVIALLYVVFCSFSVAQELQHGNNASSLRGLREDSAEVQQAESFHISLLNAVNVERAKAKLSPLCMCSQLRATAVAHTKDTALGNFMSHTSSNGSTVATRAAVQGFHYSSVGENVAAGKASVAAVMSSWMNSPSHRGNILNPAFRFFGAGYAYNAQATYCHYWTQNFAADGARATCA